MREDMSQSLVHWVKGSEHQAAETLLKILCDWELQGGTDFIKGGYRCVCFTEAPVGAFHQKYGKYQPFGLKFHKADVFELGGRPVIYQRESEFGFLAPEIQWRHVTYDPVSSDGHKDFTWEREWRLCTDKLNLAQLSVTVVVPTKKWRDYFLNYTNKINLHINSYHLQRSGSNALLNTRFPFPIEVLPN